MLERIEYSRGLLTKGKTPADLPVSVWTGEGIPERVLAAIRREGLMQLGGVYGEPSYGDPVQYDGLKLITNDGEAVEITVYNRAIALFISNNEELRRIHRALGILGEEGER